MQSSMHEHHSYGIICIHETAADSLVLLVEHARGEHWGFSKGTPEQDEVPLQTALRELQEETGVTDVHLIDDVTFQEEYTYTTTDGKVVHKVNTFFIGFVGDTTQLAVTLPDEIVQAVWVPATDARKLLTFPQAKELLDEVMQFLTKYKN